MILVIDNYDSFTYNLVQRLGEVSAGLPIEVYRNDQITCDEIAAKLLAANGTIESEPSIRFVLNWETDANDVDFHIYDDQGGHAWYASKHLASGGDL